MFRKRLNKRHLGFKRSECLEISLNGSPNKWYAVVGYIRKSTYLLVRREGQCSQVVAGASQVDASQVDCWF